MEGGGGEAVMREELFNAEAQSALRSGEKRSCFSLRNI